MALPTDFDPFEHLQSTFIKSYNKEVKEYFKELEPDTLDPDLTVPKHSLYLACKIADNDTSAMIQMRMYMFYFVLRRAQDMQPTLLGIPKESIDQTREYRPQIELFFKEDLADVDDDYRPIEARISWRLMTETSQTINKAKLIVIANKIKTEFGVGNGYTFKKGKELYTYTDKSNGIQFSIPAFSEAIAEALIKKCLDCAGVTWQAENFNACTNKSPSTKFPTLPANQVIYGETQKKPRRRPVGDVRFQWAAANIWGKSSPIYLYDHFLTHLNTLVD